METAQAVLLIVVSLLTVLLIVIGVQVFLILRDVQQSVKKANLILDDAQLVTTAVSHPLVNLSESLTKLVGLFGLVTQFVDRFSKRQGGRHV